MPAACPLDAVLDLEEPGVISLVTLQQLTWQSAQRKEHGWLCFLFSFSSAFQ